MLLQPYEVTFTNNSEAKNIKQVGAGVQGGRGEGEGEGRGRTSSLSVPYRLHLAAGSLLPGCVQRDSSNDIRAGEEQQAAVTLGGKRKRGRQKGGDPELYWPFGQ